MAVTLNTALIPACGSSRTLASRLTPLGILFQPTCRIKQRGAQARALRPYSPSALLPCSVAPQQGQALTSTSKGANPTGSRCAGDVPGGVERCQFRLAHRL